MPYLNVSLCCCTLPWFIWTDASVFASFPFEFTFKFKVMVEDFSTAQTRNFQGKFKITKEKLDQRFTATLETDILTKREAQAPASFVSLSSVRKREGLPVWKDGKKNFPWLHRQLTCKELNWNFVYHQNEGVNNPYWNLDTLKSKWLMSCKMSKGMTLLLQRHG